MESFLRSVFQFLIVLLLASLAVPAASAQNSGMQRNAAPKQEAVVTAVRLVHDRGEPAIEVVSTQPVVPTIQMLDSPPRLVIDLTHAHMGLQRKRIPVLKENILTIRAEQYQIEPAITRIVVDLLVPYGYTWDAAGNRLMVRLKPPEDTNASDKKTQSPPQVASLTAEEPAIVPVTSGVGDFVPASKGFASGASLTAGSGTAVLRLARGGEVRICPGTTVSVTPSKKSKDLMLAMSTGALETHYSLAASADTVLTPDFRILFAGPGEFDYAVSADSRGNTCVRGLKGNTSSAIVSELLGDRIYQVKPSEQLVFHSGRIDQVDGDIPPECGCPPPAPAARTQVASSAAVKDSQPSTQITLDQGAAEKTEKPQEDTNKGSGNNPSPDSPSPQTLSNGPEIQPLPPSRPNEVHIKVDAPLVYNANQHLAAPAPIDAAATLPVSESRPQQVRMEAQVQPPPASSLDAPPKPERRTLLRRIKGFFAAIFH